MADQFEKQRQINSWVEFLRRTNPDRVIEVTIDSEPVTIEVPPVPEVQELGDGKCIT